MASPSRGDGDSELILHRWPSAWGLPSLSPECVAVEAYLRLAGLRFACEDCKTPYASPSGQLPALDQCSDIVGEDAGGSKDGAARDHTGALAARRIADHLSKKVANLDAHLESATDRAHLAAYLALAESKLATATAHYTWIDKDRFNAHTREAYGAAFPAPLSYIIPWLWRRRAARRLGASSNTSGGDDVAIRAGAADAYAALSVFLRDRGGDAFMFGAKPTSLDAVVFAHLSFHALAPVGDALREELKKHPNLVAYVERVRRAADRAPVHVVRVAPSKARRVEAVAAPQHDRVAVGHQAQRALAEGLLLHRPADDAGRVVVVLGHVGARRRSLAKRTLRRAAPATHDDAASTVMRSIVADHAHRPVSPRRCNKQARTPSARAETDEEYG